MQGTLVLLNRLPGWYPRSQSLILGVAREIFAWANVWPMLWESCGRIQRHKQADRYSSANDSEKVPSQ